MASIEAPKSNAVLTVTTFYYSACLGFVAFIPLWALSVREPPVDRKGKIDWIGSALGTGSLILFNFVWK